MKHLRFLPALVGAALLFGGLTGATATPSATVPLIVWNGESKSLGFGWASPPPAKIGVESGVAHSGSTAIEMQSGANDKYVSFGWRWFPWHPTTIGTSVTAYKAVTFWIKESGATKPSDLLATLRSGDNSFGSHIAILKYQPKYANGQWDLVKIPLAACAAGSQGFNPKTVQELDFGTAQTTGVTIYVDDIGFSK